MIAGRPDGSVMSKANGKTNGVALSPVHPKPGADRVDILLGTPTLGGITIEWYNMMVGCVTPPNWALVRSTPKGYLVADAQNMLVDTVLRSQMRALLLIEDDTCPPAEAFIVFDRWFWKMERKKAPPVVSGLYHIKGSAETRTGKKGGIKLLGPEPLAYRGSGSRAYRDWNYGDVIWVSGVPTGALLVHRKVLEAWAAEPDVETYTLPGYPFPLKKIFQQPSRVWIENGGVHVASGTSDLWWSAETIKRGIIQKAGWPAKYRSAPESEHFPFIIDTSLHFKHVDRLTGVLY
jgi:hypothetical protein